MWTLRKRIRNKTSLLQCIILATRPIYFRVQFHGKLILSLLERAILLMAVSQPASQDHWPDFEILFVCSLLRVYVSAGWVSWLCSPVSASSRAREAGGISSCSSRPGRTASSVGSSGLAAPDPSGCYPSQLAGSGPRRVFPRWDTDLFAPSLLTELVGSYLSLKCYPCVTTTSYSLYVWHLLSQIRSRRAGKHYYLICFIFLSENRCWFISKNSCFLEWQILLSLGADTPSHWSKMGYSFTFFSQFVLPEEQKKNRGLPGQGHCTWCKATIAPPVTTVSPIVFTCDQQDRGRRESSCVTHHDTNSETF